MFYPYYFTEHADATNSVLHFMNTLGLLAILIVGIVLQKLGDAGFDTRLRLWICMGGAFFYKKKQACYFYLSTLQFSQRFCNFLTHPNRAVE